MQSIVLPSGNPKWLPEIFDLILHFVKAEKYNITTLRQLARTCKFLNLTLHDCISSKSNVYIEQYALWWPQVTLSPKCKYVNEIILDGLFSRRYPDDIAIAEAVGRLGDGIMPDVSVTLCKAALISSNVKLMKIIPVRCLNAQVSNVVKCIGYNGSRKMFTYFRGIHLRGDFWIECVIGALIGDNVNYLEYLHADDMGYVIHNAIRGRIIRIISGRCCEWLVAYGYLPRL